MLSPTGTCYTFDTRANGYCRSEGVVTVVIESSRVCQGGVCRVLGTSVNSDGFKDKGITFPSGRDQAANAAAAMAAGKVSPDSIAYVEAHGTGTVAGDKQELDGLSRLFYGDAATGPEAGDKSGGASSSSPFRNIPIGSVKSAMGHAEGASGLMSVVKVLAMFEHKQLLPNQKFVETAHNPLLDGRFKVVTKLEPWKPGNVCISNYGFGGTNAFAVLAPGNATYLPLCSSPTTSTAVAPLKFSNSPTTSFEGVDQAWLAQQVALGNDKQFKYRGGKKVGTKGGHDKVCFVYGGQGSQWLCMGQKLMAESAEFKATIVRLTGFLKQLDPAVADLVALFEEGDKWMDKEFTVLGIVAYQVASTNLLKSAGIVPDFYMGHSLGETAAGYARGLQSEQETIQIAYVRSRLSSKIKPGGFVVKSNAPREGKELICTSKGFHYYDLPAAEVEAETDEVSKKRKRDRV
jgi:fatty acid synthase